jgi:integrase/recombinase XerC/integrase/recombinase XerD
MKTKRTNTTEQKTLQQFIDYYELCNRAEDKSPRTIDWYTHNLNYFGNYLKSNKLPDTLDKIDIYTLRQYILHLLKKNKYAGHPSCPEQLVPVSSSTVHGHVRTLRAFFNWLVAEGLLKDSPAKGLKPPKITRKVISTLSDDEIRNILGLFIPLNPSSARNQTIFMLLIDTGIRSGELINLKIDDISMNEGLLKVIGKGRKERIVPMGSNAQRVLQRYMFRYRPKPLNPGITNVFLSKTGGPFSENGLKLVFSRLANKSGIPRLHAHLCRHTFATRFLINGGDIFSLQQILGHSSLDMVRNYVNLASSHIVIQHQKFSPLDRLNLRNMNIK